MDTKKAQSTKTRKIAAISAGALVVGIGLTYTLASWNDSEWVWGGADGLPGIGTETFNVQQNTTSPFDIADANWVDRETNPGDELTFSTGALALTPGDTVYAPVSLRTVEGSMAGDLDLQGAVAAEGNPAPQNDTALWDAVQVSVWTHSGNTPLDCDATGVGSDWTQIVTNSSLDTSASQTQALDATEDADTPGVAQNYCFAITLPESPAGVDDIKDLQGLQISPAWEFQAESN